MATLTDLPPELLDQIFHNLGSIDDVHYLGRACRATYRIIQQHNLYVEIMRSVIYQSPQHRFDLQLCRMLELRNLVVLHFKSNSGPIQPSAIDPRGLHHTKTNEIEYLLAQAIAGDDSAGDDISVRTTLTTSRIYDILARYQGLHVFQDIWLWRQLLDSDYMSVGHSLDEETFAGAYHTIHTRNLNLSSQGDVVHRLHGSADNCMDLNQDQKGRFYAAVTKIWLMNEIRWVLANFAYPANNFQVPLGILDICMDKLVRQVETPLLDYLDQYAIYTFLYQHLLPLHLPALADQCSSILPFTYSSDLEKDPGYSTRLLQLCFMAGQTYLQPPDIIDLAVRNKLRQRPPFLRGGLPASTMDYIQPSPAPRFEPNRDLTTKNMATYVAVMSTINSIYGVIQRSTVTQTAMRPIAHHFLTPVDGLYPIGDLLDAWLNERCITQFDLYAKPGRQDISNIFNDKFKEHVRWQIWWWANSEEKARMKMERWRTT